jgi:hypothetical protein
VECADDFSATPTYPISLISNKQNEDCSQTPQSGLLHSAERLVQRPYRLLN